MNADIIHIVSQYLSTDDKANLRQTCTLFSENIYWTSHERNVRANQACRNDAPEELILRLLSATTPVTTVDPYYIDLLSVACRLGKLRVVQFLAKDTRIDTKERGRAFAAACARNQEKVIEVLLADKDFDFEVEDIGADRSWLFQGSLLQVKLLLADERTRQYFNWEHAMKHAIDKGKEEISDFLLQMLLSEPSATYDVDNVMNYAASRLGLNVIRTLVMDYGVDPSAGDNAAIRAASLGGDVDFVKRLLDDPKVDPNVRALYGSALDQACRHDQADVLKLLLQDPRTDPAKDGNRAMIFACEEGAIKAVKVLLSDPRVDPSRGLPFACVKGHRGIAEILLQDTRVDPAADDNAAFIDACLGGQDDVALWLLQDPRVDPSAANNKAIQEVSKHGSARLLEALLKDPRVNPAANNNYAIRAARRKRREAVTALLLADERVDPEAEPLSDFDTDSSDD
ncbi:hypothetical protein BDZ88DRAFT_434677 [Geranomyces variabilis]|nr:hypothetical protein BDZ88DRAFT_434677 [Geranomyces variabilis]KAJ3135809.1 hypothetical protein HDU90_003548 [Geranomyces variabilis]